MLTPLNHHPAINFQEIYVSSRDPPIACYNCSFGAAERWQSGRMYLTRNQAYVQAYRGFESLPLRQVPLKINGLQKNLKFVPHKVPQKTSLCCLVMELKWEWYDSS